MYMSCCFFVSRIAIVLFLVFIYILIPFSGE